MKKIKVIALSIISTVVLLIGYWSNTAFYYLPPLFISFLYYVSTYWILEYDVDLPGLFTLLLFPSIMIFAVSTSLVVYFPKIATFLGIAGKPGLNIFVAFVFFLIMTFCTYSLVISMNVFNVSRYRRLPLLQAAQTIVYIFTSIGGYLLLNILHHMFYQFWYVVVPLSIIAAGYLIFINNWSIKKGIKENISYSIIGMFIISQFSIVLAFFPFAFYLYPLSITALVYIYNGIMNNMNKRNLIPRVSLEYLFLGIIIIGIILFTSKWGVAGNVLGY